MSDTRRTWFAFLFAYSAATLILAIGLASVDRFAVALVADTASYSEFPLGSLTEALNHIRTPGYPVFLAIVRATLGMSMIPLLHFAMHVFACGLLGYGLLRYGLPLWQAIVTSILVLMSCTFCNNLHLVSTDAPAASIAIAATGLLLIYIRQQHAGWLLLVSAAIFTAIMVRPAYLYMLGFAPITAYALNWTSDNSRGSKKMGAMVLAAVVLPVFLYGLLRLSVVGHFHVVAFGSQNLAGITTQFLDEATVAKLPKDTQQLATGIWQQKEDWLGENPDLASGFNYQQMENRWDPMVYQVVVPVANRQLGSNAIENHRAISKLNAAIIRLHLDRYAIWIGKAVRQSIRILATDIALHPPFLLAILASGVCVVLIPMWAYRGSTSSLEATEEWKQLHVVPMIAVIYFAFGMIPIVLTSAPLGRFIDAAGIFVPAALVVMAAPYFAKCFQASAR